ncbi:stage 0 sporulation protein [Patescibacteria group bacterium]|nr:stage 0 sporulation protein [Patescibacteria group bacterium]MBU0963672.1 stage 0 sporulation protein [Patescibacteria group bacterium]
MIKRVASILFHPWDQTYHFDVGEVKVAIRDKVVIKADSGLEFGTVVKIYEVDEATLGAPLKMIVRKATSDDLSKVKSNEERKHSFLLKARRLVKKYQLSMKLVDCFFSFDGGRITFVFTADGRVDFRDLVKDLARAFQKSIRLQQVGIRDEAKRLGGFGPCGREVCCRRFLSQLQSVPTDLARIQQVHSRGSDRISGSCGRLMCCLAFEAEFYRGAMKKFPILESKVKTKHGQGTVVSCNVLKKTVSVDINHDIIEMPLKEVKKL